MQPIIACYHHCMCGTGIGECYGDERVCEDPRLPRCQHMLGTYTCMPADGVTVKNDDDGVTVKNDDDGSTPGRVAYISNFFFLSISCYI